MHTKDVKTFLMNQFELKLTLTVIKTSEPQIKILFKQNINQNHLFKFT